jgi:hypothetical protein
MVAVLVAGALVAFGFHMRRERRVWFKAPGRAVVVHLADRDPVELGPIDMFGARLRPGTYKVKVEGAPDGLSEVRVPYALKGDLALPLTTDQCFVVASADGLYALKGDSSWGVFFIDKITQPGEAATLPVLPPSSDHFEMDVCDIPSVKRLGDSVFVVEPVSCREQLNILSAQKLLLDRHDGCALRKPPAE